jgi:hypothetical protein
MQRSPEVRQHHHKPIPSYLFSQYSDYATGWTTGVMVRFLAGTEGFPLLPNIQTCSGAQGHPASCSDSTKSSFLADTCVESEAGYSLLFRIRMRETILHHSPSWCVLKHYHYFPKINCSNIIYQILNSSSDLFPRVHITVSHILVMDMSIATFFVNHRLKK